MLPRTWTPDELRDPDRVAAEGYAQLRGVAGPPPADVNAANALYLGDPERLEFGEQVYRVPPTSAPEVFRLGEIVNAYHAATESAPRAFHRAHRRLVDYLWRLTLPRGLTGFVLRALLPNPFRKATPREVGEIIHFFGQRQTMSRVRFRFHPEAANRPSTGWN